MHTATFIGDVHGKFASYGKILKRHQKTIQVGDMGLGFFRADGTPDINPPFDKMVSGGHRFIRGNHDNPSVCRKHQQFIKDGTVEGDMMFVGGAGSVDRAYRTEGFNWWPDEELSYSELNNLCMVYTETKPRIMVTHDCPESIAMLMESVSGRRKLDISSRTRDALQAMFEMHQPELWVFGHWHYSFDQKYKETRFVCLAELEVKTFKI